MLICKHRRSANRAAAIGALAAVVLFAGSAGAHVTVAPEEAPAGVVQRYTVSVPSEKAMATTRVEIDFPGELYVTGVDSPTGWTVTTSLGRDGRIAGAVWIGGAAAPKQSADFGVVARSPAVSAALSWKVIQTYEDGSEVHWTGPPRSEFPAAVTLVRRGISSFLVVTLAVVLAAGAIAAATLVARSRRPRA
jgi:hypothetical protein